MLEHPHVRVTPGQSVVHIKGKPYKATKQHPDTHPCFRCDFRNTNYCAYVPCTVEERADNTNVIFKERIV